MILKHMVTLGCLSCVIFLNFQGCLKFASGGRALQCTPVESTAKGDELPIPVLVDDKLRSEYLGNAEEKKNLSSVI